MPFVPTQACPALDHAAGAGTAYQSYKATYQAAFQSAVDAGAGSRPKPSISSDQEAKVVSEWTHKRRAATGADRTAFDAARRIAGRTSRWDG